MTRRDLTSEVARRATGKDRSRLPWAHPEPHLTSLEGAGESVVDAVPTGRGRGNAW